MSKSTQQWRITFTNAQGDEKAIYMPKGLHEAEAVRNAAIKAGSGYWQKGFAELIDNA